MAICEQLNPWQLRPEAERLVLIPLLDQLEGLLDQAKNLEPKGSIWAYSLLASRLAQGLGEWHRAWNHLNQACLNHGLTPHELLTTAGDLPGSLYLLNSYAALPPDYEGLRMLFCDEGKLPYRLQQRIFAESQRLHEAKTFSDLYSWALSSLLVLTQGQRGFIVTLDRKPTSYHVESISGFSEAKLQETVDLLFRTLCHYVIHRKKLIWVQNAKNDRRLSEFPEILSLGLKSVLCVPFFSDRQLVGVIYLDHCEKMATFQDRDRRMIELVSEQLGYAFENLQVETEVAVKRGRFFEILDQLEGLHRRLFRIFLKPKGFIQNPESSFASRFTKMIGGRSRKMRELFRVLDRVSNSESTVHIFGESGTGKELVAHAIHEHGSRSREPFCTVNCSAVTESLLESELFGHEKGAFTSAHSARAGLFEMAHNGTLFLDEVGDMSLEMQIKLLRVLQEGEIRRVGGSKMISVNVRVISASNKSIQDLVLQEKFRQDLFFRLNVIMLTLPPLRERLEDLVLIANHILKELAQERKEKPKTLTRHALNLLEKYAWPGNIRELRNILERCVTFVKESEIDDGDLPEEIFVDQRLQVDDEDPEVSDLLAFPYDQAMAAFERRKIEAALRDCRGNVVRCSQIMQMQRSSLRRKLEEFQIDPRSYKR